MACSSATAASQAGQPPLTLTSTTIASGLPRSPQQEAVTSERAKAAAEEAKTQAAKQP